MAWPNGRGSLTVALLGLSPPEFLAWSRRLGQALAQLSARPSLRFTDQLDADMRLLFGQDTDGITASALMRQTHWRAQLTARGLAFEVLYGTTARRLVQATASITRRLQTGPERGAAQLTDAAECVESTGLAQTKATAAVQSRRWAWSCDKCSDPACERALLSSLLAERANG